MMMTLLLSKLSTPISTPYHLEVASRSRAYKRPEISRTSRLLASHKQTIGDIAPTHVRIFQACDSSSLAHDCYLNGGTRLYHAPEFTTCRDVIVAIGNTHGEMSHRMTKKERRRWFCQPKMGCFCNGLRDHF